MLRVRTKEAVALSPVTSIIEEMLGKMNNCKYGQIRIVFYLVLLSPLSLKTGHYI